MAKAKVKIFREGEHIDTQEVEAETEGKAETRAMMQTKCHFQGEFVSHEVEWLNKEEQFLEDDLWAEVDSVGMKFDDGELPLKEARLLLRGFCERYLESTSGSTLTQLHLKRKGDRNGKGKGN